MNDTMNGISSAFDWNSMSIQELEAAVALHNRLYWIENAPRISDVEFDRLVETLREKSPDSAVLSAIGPAGANLDAESETSLDDAPMHGAHQIAHNPPMLSLDKCYTEEALHKWFDKFEGDVLVSPKIDGVAVTVHYDENGKLDLAATRGTGRVGERITENIKYVGGIPPQIDTHDIEVRGEAYMPLSVFRERFAADYANPRNLTAGALKLKDAEATAKYGVRFFAYDVLGVEFETEADKMRWLDEIGFDPVDCQIVTKDRIQATFDRIEAEQNQRDYQMDGVVYRANRREEQVRMGFTSHHPRFSIAYKFQGDSGESVLREVHWNVSRTGAINPVGIVDPVTLSGAVVTRASLHNLAIMEAIGGEDGLMLDSRVLMTRRGGVIPHLERVIEPGDRPVEIPRHCPGCGAETRRESDVLCADHRQDCRAARLRQLEHFANHMEIKGIGPKLLEQLYDTGLVSDASDFFTLTLEELTSLDRVGTKTAETLLTRIQQRRRIRADRFLRALGIDELGRHVSELLVERYSTLDELLAVTADELVEIPTIGEVIAEKVTEGLSDKSELIDSLCAQLELVFPAPKPSLDEDAMADSPIAGRSFLFTGALESMTRSVAQKRVSAQGGDTPSSVLKSLDYLVIGDADLEKFEAGWRSSKLSKAERYNNEGGSISIIGETEFLDLLERAESQ
jgi:DNA ligase (NAD+)